MTVGEAVWKEFTAALQEAATLGEQISRQQEAVEEEEARTLAALVEKTRPVLPYISGKVLVRYYHSGGQFAEAEKDYIEGIVLVDEFRRKCEGSDDTRGTCTGQQLVLTRKGVLLVLTREGHWSNWQNEPSSWQAEAKEVTPLEAVQRFDFADIVQGLVDGLREAINETEKKRKQLEKRASRLAGSKKLVED